MHVAQKHIWLYQNVANSDPNSLSPPENPVKHEKGLLLYIRVSLENSAVFTLLSRWEYH